MSLITMLTSTNLSLGSSVGLVVTASVYLCVFIGGEVVEPVVRSL